MERTMRRGKEAGARTTGAGKRTRDGDPPGVGSRAGVSACRQRESRSERANERRRRRAAAAKAWQKLLPAKGSAAAATTAEAAAHSLAPCLFAAALATLTPAKMEREREQLKSIIDEWNVNRLDLFELSQPNEVSPLPTAVCPVPQSGGPLSRRPNANASQNNSQQQLLISKTSRDKCVCVLCVRVPLS